MDFCYILLSLPESFIKDAMELGSALLPLVIQLEGENSLRALVRRTVREGKGVHREMESEESCIQNADLTNRKCI